MGMTMTQKILADHAGLERVQAGELIEVGLDMVLGNDVTAPVAIKELSKFKRISDEKKIGRQKQTVTLRLSGKALNKAKSLGKGYTSILSRILESALEDPELVKHYL